MIWLLQRKKKNTTWRPWLNNVKPTWCTSYSVLSRKASPWTWEDWTPPCDYVLTKTASYRRSCLHNVAIVCHLCHLISAFLKEVLHSQKMSSYIIWPPFPGAPSEKKPIFQLWFFKFFSVGFREVAMNHSSRPWIRPQGTCAPGKMSV